MGVVMYHLLAGRLPFQASNNFSLITRSPTSIPALPSYRPEIPSVDAIVRRAMARDLTPLRGVGGLSRDLADAFRDEKLGDKTQEFADSTSSTRCAARLLRGVQ